MAEPKGQPTGYRVPEVTRIVGISYRQLDYWARTGLVRPSIRDAQGSGTQRLYSFQDLAVLKLVKRMLDSGVNLQQIRKAMGTLKDLKEPALGTTLISDGSRIYSVESPDEVVGMGGAVTNLTAVKHELETYDPSVIQGATLEAAEADRQIELYRTRTADERREIVGLQPKRAEVILAGALIVRTVLAELGRESLTVSDRGLRHGVLAERFGR